jgi:hypothetical protein
MTLRRESIVLMEKIAETGTNLGTRIARETSKAKTALTSVTILEDQTLRNLTSRLARA